MADTPTNAELAAQVVGAVDAVRGAQSTVENAATLLANHLGDPKAHGAETKANILAAVPKPVWDGKNLGFKNDDNSLSVPAVDLSGPIGPKGEPGLTPSHQWNGTKLKFQNPDGTWPAAGTELKSDSTAEAQEAATIAAGAAERASSSELSVSANADIATQKASVASTAADTATAKAQESATSATAAATSATAAATSAQNAAKSASDAATNATLTAASVDAVTAQAGKAKIQADRAQSEADRAAAVAIPAQEGVTGMVEPGRGLGITTPGTLDLDIAGANALGGVQIATAADVASGAAGEVPKVLAVGSDALNALMPTMLIGSIQKMFCADSYVPNGTVPADAAEYTREQFREFYDTYLVGGKLISCTYAAFAAQVALTGNCAKFAIDTTTQKFKVPLLKDGDSITQAASAAELGKSVKAGLPNITGTLDANVRTSDYVHIASGAFSRSVSPIVWQGLSDSGGSSQSRFTFNANASNSIYGNSTTVTDEQVRLRHFVVLASAQNSASVFDWSNYMAGLAGKLNVDFSNADFSKYSAILQIVPYETGALATCSTPIPVDDTIPQITEGTQVLAATITPKSATSRLRIDVCVHVGLSSTASWVAALFQGANVNAIAATTSVKEGTWYEQVVFSHIMPSPETSPVTFSVRIGAPGSTLYLNGAGAARLMGGVMSSSIIITEIAA